MIVTPPSSRNAPCPCGSGKRFKDCHGSISLDVTMVDVLAPMARGKLERARAALVDGAVSIAEPLWQEVLVIDANNAEANFHIGNLQRERGETHASITSYERALGAAPDNAAVLNNLGLALEAVGERERAFDCYRQILTVNPMQSDALGNLGNALYEREDYSAAASAYTRLSAVRRDLPVATVVRRGIALKKIGHLDEAAARREPDDVRILAHLGSARVEQLRYDTADAPLARAHELDPDNGYVLSLLAHARMQCCAWDGIDRLFRELERILDGPPHEYWKIAQLQLLSMPLSPQKLRRAAAQWGHTFAPQHTPKLPTPISPSDGRLRVAFVSSDFRLHPMASVITEVLERLDRSRLDVHAYGLRPPDVGPVGRRIAAAVDHFIDLSQTGSAEAVQRIRADDIAIAFDLNGYSGNCRPELFSHRSAPIQINSIGFPGTLGVDWYEYIHLDSFVAPESASSDYSERLFYMPHSYYASDTTRIPKGPPPLRTQYGLPDDAFVYCSFNNTYKILPEIFHAWIRILHATPGSVLWLLEGNSAARDNLRGSAMSLGLAVERLIFAPRVDTAEHIARCAIADLFLDTTPCGAHTTANDALLAGLPVLTIAGDTFASRVAGSQLHAIGLPELVTNNLADYEALAIALARDPPRLLELRERLSRNRRTHPLFDMARYARDLEDGLLAMWQLYVAETRNASR
jgi:protein O-GlcNAc transferase